MSRERGGRPRRTGLLSLLARLRSAPPALARVRSLNYLRKWIILGAVIGVVAGLGALVFIWFLKEATHLLLGVIGGYAVPTPAGEGNSPGSGGHFVRPWAIPLIVAGGGLLSGILVFTLAPEAEGHGTDSAISAVHHNPRGVRARVAAIKIVASALTIGSGGSGGREGPTAQISSGFGSLLARWLDLSPADARIAVAVGIGSGIGSIFRTPLGGAVLGAEILYRDDIETEALIPSVVASIVGFVIFGASQGFSPLFGFHDYRFRDPVELVYYVAIGLAAGLMGILYDKSFYGVTRWAKRIPGSRMWRPAMAGLFVGLLGLLIPAALGTGYGWLQQAMSSRILSMSLWVVLALPFAKILATSLSIGSGGSGGIFGPGMVIGGFTGAAIWRLAQHLPGVPHDPVPFVIVGMIACFGSIAHAPIAVMLMVAEMTGSLELLAPAMVAVGIATVVVGDHHIYSSQLRSRAESPAHRLRFGLPLLGAVPIEHAMSRPRLVLPATDPAGASADELEARPLQGAPVVDEDGRYVGVVDAERLRSIPADQPVGRVADREAETVPDSGSLEEAAEALATGGRNWVPVLDAGRGVVGVVAVGDLVRAYREALESGLHRLAGTLGGAVLLEETVGEDSPVAGRPIGATAWLPGTFVVALMRDHHVLFPQGDTVVRPGDLLSIFASRDRSEAVRSMIRAAPAPPERVEDRDLGPDMV